MKWGWLIIFGVIILSSCQSTKQIDYSCPDCNVILIVVDTLRADHLGCYGYERNTSPNIDEFASKSILFNNAYSAASWTRSAIASILTSKLPLEHNIYSEDETEWLDDSFFTIQEYFESKGYYAGAIYTNPHLDFGLVQAFNYSYFKSNQNANFIYDHAIDWITVHSNDKFFLLIHNNDPHDPYAFHEEFDFSSEESEYRKMQAFFPPSVDGNNISCDNKSGIIQLNEAELSEMEANYDGEIAFVDFHFGRLLSYLKEKKLDTKTIIVFTSDHGEEFLDHGGYWHGCTLYNELLKVPLIVYLPKFGKKKFKQRVSTIDLFPTLIDIFEKQNLKKYIFTGQSLLPLLEGEEWTEKPIFSATAFRAPLKYSMIYNDTKIIKYAEGNSTNVYNLNKDSAEQINLIGQNKKLEKFLNNQLNILIKTKKKDIVNNPTREIDEQTKEQLKSLGYVG